MRPIVLVANLGTPRAATPECVADFLREFLSDPLVVDYPRWLWRPVLERLVLRSRPAHVARMYRAIAVDGRMPLERGTDAIAAALAQALDHAAEVRAVYRYGHPSVAQAVDAALAQTRAEVFLVPLFPQRTPSSSETVVEEAIRHAEGFLHRLRVLRIAPDDPAYIYGCAERVREATRAAGFEFEHLVLSFHGLPRRYDRLYRYRSDCWSTARALLAELGVPAARATVSYQSRFGPEPWIGPATFGVLRALARRGVERVAVATPGFLTDGLETLDEIGARGRRVFLDAGGKEYVCAKAVGDHPALIAGLADAVASHVPLLRRMAHAS